MSAMCSQGRGWETEAEAGEGLMRRLSREATGRRAHGLNDEDEDG